MESQPSFDQIDSFFRRYQTAFEQLEPREIIRFWHAPTLILKPEPESPKACADDADLLHALEITTAQLRQAGMHSVRFLLDEVRILHQDLVDCVIHWQLRDAAGATFTTLHNIYVLRREEGDWGVAAVHLLRSGHAPLRLTRAG